MAGQQGDFGVVAGDIAEGGQRLRFGSVVVGSRRGEEIAAEVVAGDCLLGELALDGRLRTVRGVLPAVLAAKRAGWGTVVVPARALAEAGLVKGIEVLGADDLSAVIGWLRGELALAVPDVFERADVVTARDLSEVVGQTDARWAIEVAAAGAHHLMLTGPPGIGKRCWRRGFRGFFHR